MNIDTHLLLLSAPDRPTLLAQIDDLQRRLEGGEPGGEQDVRPEHPERLAIVYPRGELAQRLTKARGRLTELRRDRLAVRDLGIHFGSAITPGQIAFLFPGEGSQRVGMLRQAYERLAPVRDWLDTLDRTYLRRGELPPSRYIYPPAGEEAQEDALFDVARGAQLGTVLNLALHEVVTSLGIRPHRVLGHSNGEHSAVMAACLDLPAQRALACEWLRSASAAGLELGAPQPPEAMAAVSNVPPELLDRVLARFPGELFLAMDNCPLQQMLAGRRDAVRAAAAMIAESGAICGELPFSRAYHSPLFAPWARMLAERYQDLPLLPPRIPVVSCLDGAEMGPTPEDVRRAMAGQWTAPVRLRKALEALYDGGVRTFVEIGPDAKLTAFVTDTLRGRPHLAVPSNSPTRGDIAQLHFMLAALHAHGVPLDPGRLKMLEPTSSASDAPVGMQAAVAAQTALIAAARAGMARMGQLLASLRGPVAATQSGRASLLGPSSEAKNGRLSMKRTFSLAKDSYLADHSLGRPPARPLAVLSFTTSLALAAEAARQAGSDTGTAVMTDLRASRWLGLDGGKLNLRLETERNGPGFRVSLHDGAAEPSFSAEVAFSLAPPPLRLELEPGSPPRRWTPETFYRDYAFHGPSFQGLRRVTEVSSQGIAAELTVTSLPGAEPGTLEADPALLDCAGQLVAFWLLEQAGQPPTVGIFPYAARQVVLREFPPPGTLVQCRGTVAFHDGIRTEASFVFTAQGREIASIEGLAQRVLELPSVMAARIFGGPGKEMSAALDDGSRRLDLSAWRETLEGNDRIWARALAHLILNQAELARWLAHPDPDALLVSALAKETAMDWARRRGLAAGQESDIVLQGGLAAGPSFEMDLEIGRDGKWLTARIKETAHG